MKADDFTKEQIRGALDDLEIPWTSKMNKTELWDLLPNDPEPEKKRATKIEYKVKRTELSFSPVDNVAKVIESRRIEQEVEE